MTGSSSPCVFPHHQLLLVCHQVVYLVSLVCLVYLVSLVFLVRLVGLAVWPTRQTK